MRKVFLFLFAFVFSLTAFSQAVKKSALSDKPSDHFMIQLANNYWVGAADSVSSRIKSFNRSANVYVMYDKKFRTNPKFSIGIGVGVGTANMYFNKMNVNITNSKSILPFIRTDTGNNFKKYKLTTAFLEIPLELRFCSKPDNPNKAIKAAVGVKVGTLINVHTKAKGLRNAGGASIAGYTEKESSKGYFNGTRISLTGRVGYGLYSLFGSYGLTNLFKDGVAPVTNTLQIGIAISGL